MSRKKTHEEYVKQVYNVVGDEYTVLDRYVNANTKIKLRHNECGHEWSVYPNNLLRGHGCPKCAKKRVGKSRRKTNEEFLKQLRERYGEDYEPLEEHKIGSSKIKVKHLKCGNVYITTPNNILSGRECPKCAEKQRRIAQRKYTQEDFEAIVESEGNGEYEVLGKYTTVENKVKIRHKSCNHIYQVSPAHFKNGRRCPECAKKLRADAKRKTQDEFEKDVKAVHGEEYIVLGEYYSSTTKVKMKHNICGYIWDVVAGSILLGHGCPRCNSSKGEKSIRSYLENNNIVFKEEYIFDDCRNELPLPFDFKVKTNKDKIILIEYHGEQHYRPIEFYGGVEKFKRQQRHDAIKRGYCKANNIPLIEIPYWEEDIEAYLKKQLNKIM